MFELILIAIAFTGVAISGRGFLAATLLAVAFREISTAGPGQLWIDVACDPSRATEVLEVEIQVISTRD